MSLKQGLLDIWQSAHPPLTRIIYIMVLLFGGLLSDVLAGSLQQQLGAQQQQLVQQLQAVQRQYLMHGPLSVPANAPPSK
jgi:hypothetical protein